MNKREQSKFYQGVGIRIRDARRTAGLNQETFGSYLDLSRVSVVNIEKGRQRPSLHLLKDISRILSLEISWFLKELPDRESMTNTDHIPSTSTEKLW